MKGLLATFLIYVILEDTVLSLSESDSCDGEHCGSVITMPLMDNMKASLKADLDVSKMNKHLKAYIEQEIKKGVKTAMESMMQQMIEHKTEKMNSEIKTMTEKKNAEITVRLQDAEEKQMRKTVQMEQLIKNKSEEMLTLFQDNAKRHTEIMDQMELLIKNKSEEMLILFQDNKEKQTIKTDQMELFIKNKSAEMLRSFKDNDYKSKASFDVKMEEFKQKFERKDRLKYAFFSHLSSDKNSLQDKTVIYDVVPLNIGSAYDGTTGKFTCKEDGIYTFSWTSVSHPKQEFTSAFVVDGTPKACNVVDSELTDDNLSGSISVIVKMAKGQQAWIQGIHPDGDYLDASWSDSSIPSSVFSGFKI